MSLFYKISNTWRKCNIYYKLNSTVWKELKNIWYKTSNGWKPAWQYNWITGSWSACSAPCGGGIQTRTVTCRRNDGLTKHDIFCNDLGSKPAVQQGCNTQACVTYETSYCTSTCQNIVLSTRRYFNMDNSQGHLYIGSFSMGNTNGRSVLLTTYYDFHDIAINCGFSAKTTSDPTIRFLPNLCTKVYRCTGVLCSPDCTGNDCNTGNDDRRDAYLYYIRFSKNAKPVETRSLIQIPGNRLGNGDIIDLYIFVQDVRGYSGNNLWVHGRDVQKYTYACIM